MSRKRDTNWTRDEITVLLDSIEEMTRMRADGGRRTNSREVFEFAARKLGEKGHTSRAEREKCRTKWKKMKEEFTHARRARETGQGRVAPGIEPFYSRMLEFINGNFDNISPHSTIVRRSSSISSNNTSTNNGSTNNGHITNSTINGVDNGVDQVNADNISGNNRPAPLTTPTNHNKISHAASRASARLAANSTGVPSNDTSDTTSAIDTTRRNNASGPEFSPGVSTSSDSRPRHNARLSPSSAGNPASIDNSIGRYTTNNNNNNINNGNNRTYVTSATNGSGVQNNHDQHQATVPKPITYDDNSYSNHIHDNSSPSFNITTNNTSSLNNSNDFTNHLPPAERDADISYRVSTGCRQIIIFGDHDVDIKFRGDCVTINKISSDYTNAPASINSPDA